MSRKRREEDEMQGVLFPEDKKKSGPSAVERKGQITIDDMPNDDMRLVAETLGVQVAVDLLRHLGGITLSIPKRGLGKLAERLIRAEYDGSNAKRLAVQYGVTERFVQIVANGQKGERDND
ncbi:MAG TPA: Mor transcription activator family protein [Candidatus Ozemobacteraceae bacterium]|nr:Mor transcription activator family protein [Candidatus Ozemobacteraceae bacterium]